MIPGVDLKGAITGGLDAFQSGPRVRGLKGKDKFKAIVNKGAGVVGGIIGGGTGVPIGGRGRSRGAASTTTPSRPLVNTGPRTLDPTKGKGSRILREVNAGTARGQMVNSDVAAALQRGEVVTIPQGGREVATREIQKGKDDRNRGNGRFKETLNKYKNWIIGGVAALGITVVGIVAYIRKGGKK